MATETKLGTIHLFPSYSSYNTNKASVATSDIALIPSTGGTVIEFYSNGTNWYRVWSDGTIQQGGIRTTTGTVTFLKPFSNDSYNLTYGNTNGDGQGVCAQNATATSFYIANNTTNVSWQGWYAIGT